MEIILMILMFLMILIVAFLFAATVVVVRVVNPPKQALKTPKELSENEKRKAERLRQEVTNMLSYVGDPQEEIHVD